MGTNDFDKQFEKAEPFERPPPLPLRRDTAPPKSYPLKALGKVGAGAAEAIMDKVQCPDAIAGQSVLAAMALAVQAHVDVTHPATTDCNPSSFFIITVAASGERKSAADKIAVGPIRLREATLHEQYDRDQRVYHDARDVHQRGREEILRKHKGNPAEAAKQLEALGPPPWPPLLPMLTAPDPTLEGLQKLMVTSEPSMGLFTDEGGSFLGGYGMSDEARLRTSAGLSSFWDGTPVRRVRGGDGATILKGRRLSVHIMVQPGIAGALLSDPTLQSQGLPSRFLVAAPASLAGTRHQRPLKPTTEPALKKYQDIMLKLLRKKPRRVGSGAELDPLPLQLSAAALQLWIAFADECERDLGPGGRLEAVRAFAGKLAEHALRIAAVLQVFDKPEATEISAEVFTRAMTLARFYAGEALRLFEQGELSADIQRAERLLKWLHEKWAKPRVGLAHIYQLGPNAIRDTALARQLMVVLENHHWVVRIEGGAKIDGKHHREAWEIIMA